ncbi:peptidase S8 [Leptolyngbya sp. FACHB-36]|uniref:S8 family peptidase n=1 Tax=Leptolyngbya sp. FACHB-36 TaxID=2692808 RepID=UPI0016801D8C|nr:S8 family peptidase [Leptolyngbya sp. FACHB-36]MBD2022120.1 peptidase S8 [Leptolyngbya sp. FACHB-36]
MKRLLLLGLFLVGFWWAISNYTGLATQGTYKSIVLDFREDVGAAQIEQQVQTIAKQFKVTPRYNSEFSFADHVFVVQGDRKLLESLKRSDVRKYTEFIEPDYIYSAFFAPNDPDYSKQWNLRSINVESAWEDTKGSGVTVAVIDTGISQVPDLKDTQFVKGYDFVNDREDATDDNGHGTHVAGTVAQSTNNSFGVAGIAYEASLMPLKVLSAGGGGTVADIAEAIRFAADNNAQVINMSLGGGGESQLMKEAIDYAHSKGVVVIAAAGNTNDNSASYPARYAHVIGVSALGPSGSKASYSNFGAGVDISAPGGETGGTDPAGGVLQNTIDPETGESIFEAYQGTSMAAPHVAGVAALVRAAGIESPDEIEDVLKQSALQVKDDSLNHYGAGKLDAAAAVKLAVRGQITFRDFFRWLRDNGYLNPRFWLDGGVIALWPKVLMVLGSYLLAWFLRNYFPFAWSGSLSLGLVMGSSGLFFLRGLYLFDAPQWPFRLMGSSIPELGTAVQGTTALNPLFASVLIPLGLLLLLLGHAQWKWFAVGTTLGVSACLVVSAVASPDVLWLGNDTIARAFLMANAVLCFLLARLAVKPEGRSI